MQSIEISSHELHNIIGIKKMETLRLRLRQWRQEDLEPFAEINADPRVMEFLPKLLSKNESDAMVERIYKKIDECGWGLWALEKIDSNEFLGFVGLSEPTFEAHFTPCVEIGWRLKFDAWGQGFATEAGFEVLRYGFEDLHLPEIVSFTSKLNIRSIKVMERLGMRHCEQDDFEHPNIKKGQPLCPHVLYRLKNPTLALSVK